MPKASDIESEEEFEKTPDLLLVANPRTLGFLQASLVKYGWKVAISGNIGDAVHKLRKSSPKMVLVLAGMGYLDPGAIRLLINVKGDSRLILLDPDEIIPQGIKGIDSIIRGSFPLHHLLAIIHGYIENKA